MAGKRKKKFEGRYVGIPHNVVSSAKFIGLSAHAVKLLLDLAFQYTGYNNGNLTACWTFMRERGWKSSSTLHKALRELIDAGFVVITRQGMKVRAYPTLLAITWSGVDEVPKIRYDDGILPNQVPLNLWRFPDRLHASGLNENVNRSRQGLRAVAT
tara:strand:+ start:1269 stop:1736 length:468 start_codon:yes stop_codon:yes gene_type:complete